MAKFEIKFDTKKLEKELNKQFQKIAETEGIKAGLISSWQGEDMKILDKMTEKAFEVILLQYDGNPQLSICGDYDIFPEYMKFSINEIFSKLKFAGLIASVTLVLRSWCGYLTPDGISYFEDKKSYLRGKQTMFNKLPSNSEALLNEILQTEDPVGMLTEKFETCTTKDVDELRSLMRELSDYGLIETQWASNVPYYLTLNNSARTYSERKKEYEESMKKAQGTTVNIDTFNAHGSNVVMGDAINSALSIDNSIQRIEDRIEKEGGEDKEELKLLLEDVKEMIENIETSRNIPKNKRFFNQLSSHLEKHGWFYSEIIGLLGTMTIGLLQG